MEKGLTETGTRLTRANKMNKALSLVFILIIIATCVVCDNNSIVRAQDEKSVTFPDANLEVTIRWAIDKPEGFIYVTDLESITCLISNEGDISNLVGLEYCTNLTMLNLSRNQISDLSPLASLTSLTSLNLGQNQVSDLSPLASLTNLTTLRLHENRLTDLSPLASLTNLINLDLDDNQISDLSPLASLTNLRYLHLIGNQISDLSSLASLTSLTSLNLGQNQVSDLSPLAFLTSLTELYLVDNQISDLSPLNHLNNLTELWLYTNQISDLSPLASLTNLRQLKLSGNQISDISPLSSLTNLPSLNLGQNQISDLSPLIGLRNLMGLDLHNNNISDISPLLDKSCLLKGATVFLDNNPLSDTSLNVYMRQLVNRGIDIYPKPSVDTATILHPGVLLALVCAALVAVMIVLLFYRTNGSRRKQLRRNGLIAGIIGAGLSTFFLFFIVCFNCQYSWWYLGLPEVLYFVVVPGMLLFGSVAIAWKSERIGGMLLIIEGIANPPLLVSGLLFLLSQAEGRTPLPVDEDKAAMIYSSISGVVIWPVCYFTVERFFYEMEALGLLTFVILGFAGFLLSILFTFFSKSFGGVLMLIIGLVLPLLFIRDYCIPVYVFFTVTLPIMASGTLFLLSWWEERKYT